MDRPYCEETKHLESAGSQKDRKTEANSEEECFGGAGKCGKTESKLKSNLMFF